MALSTSTTITTTIASEILSSPLMALKPRAPVYLNLCNQVNIDGIGSMTYKIPRQTLFAIATAATEGTDFTTISDFGYTSAVSIAPTSIMSRGDLTDKAIRRGLGGKAAEEVFNAMQANDVGLFMSLLKPYCDEIMESMWRKAEFDAQAQLANASQSVGTSGSDMTIANALGALILLEAGDTEHDEFAYVWQKVQLGDMRTAALAGTGPSLSTLFTSVADASFVNFNKDLPRNGLKGTFLNVPVYVGSQAIQPTANTGADVVGAIVAIGRGEINKPGSLRGATQFVEGHAPRIQFAVDMSARTVELLGIWEYGLAEATDLHYVSIITDL